MNKLNILVLLLFVLITGCDQPKETVKSDQVSTSKLIRWSEVKNTVNGTTILTVYLQSSEWRTRDLGSGESSEQYHPDVVLSGGEYLDVVYDGELIRFSDGDESPFDAHFRRAYGASHRVTFYRKSGEVVTIN